MRGTATLLVCAACVVGCQPEPALRAHVDFEAGAPPPPPASGTPLPEMPPATLADAGSAPAQPIGERTDAGAAPSPAPADAAKPVGEVPRGPDASSSPVAMVDSAPTGLPRSPAAGVLEGVALLCDAVAPADDLVSTFDQAPDVLPRGGRMSTAWELIHDNSSAGTIARADSAGPCGGRGVLRFQGSGFSVWGASSLAFLNARGTYDASAYRGMRVRLRAAAPVTTRLKVTDWNNWAGGGPCKLCGNSFGRDALVGTAWREYVLWFDDLTQTPDGDRYPALDRRALVAFEVIGMKGVAFDIEIDDLAFFR